MSVCKFFSQSGLIYIAFTIHLVRGFSWTKHHRIQKVCPVAHGEPSPSIQFTKKHRLLLFAHEEEDDWDKPDPELEKPRDPEEPSPFALFLVDRQFSIFEKKLNEELKFAKDNLPVDNPPVWDINNYKAYLMKAYCLLRIMYDVRAARETGNGTCDHIIIPKQGEGGFGFIVNYVISKSASDLRDDAKRCVQKMVDQNFGRELVTRYPPLDAVFKVGIAFNGPNSAVEWSKAPPRP